MKKLFFIFTVNLIFSFLLFLSLRLKILDGDYKFNYLLFFIFCLVLIWSLLFINKSKLLIVFTNIYIILIINFLLTPFFFQKTFDVPVRMPNYIEEIEYKGEYFKGLWSGKHIITTDEKGFRTTSKINYKKKDKEVFRILTIGASTTEENGTDDNKTWSAIVAKNINSLTNKKVELINTGLSGLRAKHHYLSLLRSKNLNPDLVIFLVGINDWNHHINNRHLDFIFPYIEINFNFDHSILSKISDNIRKQLERKLNLKFKKEIKRTFPAGSKIEDRNIDGKIYKYSYTTDKKFEDWLKPISNSLSRQTIVNYNPKDVFDEYKNWIRLIYKECKKNFTCIILNQPNAYDFNADENLKKRFWMTPPYEDYTISFNDLVNIANLYNNWILEEAKKEKIFACDLASDFKPTMEYFIDDCHFSENGSKFASTHITNCIKKFDIIN